MVNEFDEKEAVMPILGSILAYTLMDWRKP
jgi:hypothetical protein